MPTDLRGKRVTVMGLGRFGGGLGVTRFLVSQGARVVLTDSATADALAEPLAQLGAEIDAGSVELRLGAHEESDFVQTDLVVANPAVPTPWNNPFLCAALAAGVPITTEVSLLWNRLPRRDRVIAVTGTAGKSTTTAMIAHALRAAAPTGAVFAGGNLGGSLLCELGRIGPSDWIVLEVSSAMLHWLTGNRPPFRPRIAVVTNFAPNHADWHGSIAHYLSSKRRLLEHLEPPGGTVLGPGVSDWPVPPGVERVAVGPGADPGVQLSIPGGHNRTNAAIALAVIAQLSPEGIDLGRALGALAAFPGLAHRLALTHEADGVRWYDDSKSTTPGATVIGIRAFEPHPQRVILIAGGYDKKIPLDPMVLAAAGCKLVLTVGATGEPLAAAVCAAGGRAEYVRSLDAAVPAARAAATPGDSVLLSPGCASWDQFDNFESRGRRFASLARGSAVNILTRPAQEAPTCPDTSPH